MTTEQIEKQIDDIADFKVQAAYIKKNLVAIEEAYVAQNNAINAKLEGKIGPDDLKLASQVRLNAVDRLRRQIETKGFDRHAVERAIEKNKGKTNEQIQEEIAKAKKLTFDTPMHEQLLVTIFRDLVSAFAK